MSFISDSEAPLSGKEDKNLQAEPQVWRQENLLMLM